MLSNTKGMKRIANSITRQKNNLFELPLKGNTYKKLFCSYDINDGSRGKPFEPDASYKLKIK
jgi:hypothetical protein